MATILNINQGGTNATSPAGARNSLGIKSAALKESISSSIVNNSDTIPTSNLLYDVNFNLSKITECFSNKEIGNGETGNVLSVKNGGTGVSNYTDLRNNLGIEITQLINLPIGIENGGTGASNQEDACRALLPDISGKSGNVLQVLGNNIVWSPVSTSGAVNVTKTINLTGPVTATTTSNFGEGNSIELKTSIDMDNMPIIPITHGGTGATTQEDACKNILPSIDNNNYGNILSVNEAGSIEWINPEYKQERNRHISVSGVVSGSILTNFNGTDDIVINTSFYDDNAYFTTLPLSMGGTGAESQVDACKNILPSTDNASEKYVLQLDSDKNIIWAESPSIVFNEKPVILTGSVEGSGTINFDGKTGITITAGKIYPKFFESNIRSFKLTGAINASTNIDFSGFNTAIEVETKIDSTYDLLNQINVNNNSNAVLSIAKGGTGGSSPSEVLQNMGFVFKKSTDEIPDASNYNVNVILFQYEILS